MPEARIGTSGYQYDDWRGLIYPRDLPREAWLGHYAQRFGTVELDTTFYGLPRRTTVRQWHDRVPDGFVFAAKMSRYGTHLKRLRDPADWLDRFFEAMEPLGTMLGPVLVQLPPRWHRDVERLLGLLEAWPEHRRLAVELRDPDWLHTSVYDALRKHGAALCIHDLIDDHPRLVTADWVYLRFHGPDAGRPYAGSYSTQALSGAARRIRRHLEAGRDVYAYFNNDRRGQAVRDAADLQRYASGHGAGGAAVPDDVDRRRPLTPR